MAEGFQGYANNLKSWATLGSSNQGRERLPFVFGYQLAPDALLYLGSMRESNATIHRQAIVVHREAFDQTLTQLLL